MYSVVLTEFGVVVYENDKVVRSFPFSNPVNEYLAVRKKESELSELIRYLAKLDTGVTVSDDALHAVLKKASIDVQSMSEEQSDEIQANKPKIIAEGGFAKDAQDAFSKLRDFALQLSSSKVTEVSQSPDLHIIQSISALDEMDKIINGISSRLREWYGLHFPELDNIIDSIHGYSQIVLAGKRSNLTKKVFEDAGFPDSKVEMLDLVKSKSRGGDITDENLAIVQDLAREIIQMYDTRKKLEDHIEKQMNEIAPNLSAILGTAVGARILAKAGTLKKLASLPASTIQVLGAEKALFRSLKTGAQPPKHGLLFQHALVHASPRWQRGKIARAVAAKAAIAARVDVYGGGLNKTLLEKLNVRIDEIGKKYDKPTEKPAQHFQRQEKREGFGRERRGDEERRSSFGERKSGFGRERRGDDERRSSFGERKSGFGRERRGDDERSDSDSKRWKDKSKTNKMKGKKNSFGRR